MADSAPIVKPTNTYLSLVQSKIPSISIELAVRFASLGYAETDIAKVSEMIELHETQPVSIIRWAEAGASLEQIDTALTLRPIYPRASVAILVEIQQEIDLQMVGLDAFMAAFEDVLDTLSGQFPLHQLKHRIEERLDGDWHKARSMAIDNPYLFKLFVWGSIDEQEFYSKVYPELNTEDLTEEQTDEED